MNIMNRKIGAQKRAHVTGRRGSVPGLTGSVTKPGATGLGGATVRGMEKYSGSFMLDRSESLVGFTGGWTYSLATKPGMMPSPRPTMPGMGG